MRLPADWMTADWPAPARVRTLLTTRTGGVSAPPFDSMNLGMHVGDEPGSVADNRRSVRALLPAEPCWLRQVHGTRAVEAVQAAAAVEEADACIARAPGQVCVVLIADCLPVLLCDRAGTVVAAAHAGWRGLSAGVVERTVARMPVASGQLLAHLGPAIGPTAFEVGADVLDAFCASDPGAVACFVPTAPGPAGEPKWLCDLPGLARRRLQALGVDQVSGGDLCTYRDPARFFSHRRDRRTGRQAALVWLEP
jgi:hypothetical protein